MKHNNKYVYDLSEYVAPPAGAWIETLLVLVLVLVLVVAPPAGAWIETLECIQL